MGKIVKFCNSCDEGFAEKFGFCPNCGQTLTAFEMNPVVPAAPPAPEFIAAPPAPEIIKVVEPPVEIVNLRKARALPHAAAFQIELPLYEKTSRSSIR